MVREQIQVIYFTNNEKLRNLPLKEIIDKSTRNYNFRFIFGQESDLHDPSGVDAFTFYNQNLNMVTTTIYKDAIETLSSLALIGLTQHEITEIDILINKKIQLDPIYWRNQAQVDDLVVQEYGLGHVLALRTEKIQRDSQQFGFENIAHNINAYLSRANPELKTEIEKFLQDSKFN